MTKTAPVTGNAGEKLVTVGVDTHLDSHVAVALDDLGRRLGEMHVPTTVAGYAKLLRWAKGFGELQRVGIEGAGSFGAGLSRFLRKAGVEVLEVGRPKRRDQHRAGKSDPIDAELAARAVLAGTAIGGAKDTEGTVEMIRVLRAARRSAVKACAQAAKQLKGLLVTAPDNLRDELRGLSTAKLVRRAAGFRPGDLPEDVASATKFSLRSIARRYRVLSEEIRELDGQLKRLVTETAPALVAVHGVGIDTAATLLVAIGQDPRRLKSEAAFAHLCGVAPIPASSGKVIRYRLNRRGNRDANRALHVVAAERMSRDERTRSYVARRTCEGKSKREIMRCLKRYIARELYGILVSKVVPPTSLLSP
ncbi:MAG: IS110 family transposase [Actinomycetota bacterium]|nr:IS110 family transposase [Actinomycetota bacterium]